MKNSKYETVIGLEVHVQLDTNTKIFCSCGTGFGAPPNSLVCPVCLGLPGVLPVLNKKAFKYAIKVAIALGCDIQKKVKFDRKNYYYPDLPKNYQISQYDMPLAYNGKVSLPGAKGEDARVIGITRAHLEEDAGKLLHDAGEACSYVDLNRTGMPLLEIVSEPDIRTPQEAHKFLTVLKQIIEYLEVSDCNMEEGSLRCDANISLRKKGEKKLGVKVEIKNLNSFRAVRDALHFEEVRQEEMLEDGADIVQETRLWNEVNKKTLSMRSKEEAQDYRYFPEPDLVPFEIHTGIKEEIAKDMPELPEEKTKRFILKYALSCKDVELLVAEKSVADFFEQVMKYFKNPAIVCNWVKGEVLRHLKEKNVRMGALNLTPKNLANLIEMVEDGTISGLSAKEVLDICVSTGRDPRAIVDEKGFRQVSDKGELAAVIGKVIKDNQQSVNDYKNGKTNALGFLVGQVMKATKGKANPKLSGEMLSKVIRG